MSFRAIEGQIDRAALRTTLMYSVAPRLSIGIEYNPKASSVSPLANAILVRETSRRPALIAGTSSDRIGTPSGQSFYLTVSKDLRREIHFPLAPYVGVAYGTYEDRARLIGGLNVAFGAGFSSLVIYDGVHVHPTLRYARGRHGLSLILAQSKHPGLSYNVRF
jgi:hypothetical protein